MPACAHPKSRWNIGKDNVTWREPLSPSLWNHTLIRCGKCAPCLLHKGGQRSTRLTLERFSHSDSIACCLTYAPAFVPAHGSLRKADPLRFINSLRKRLERRDHPEIDYHCIGEYSPAPSLRPHYHLILYGYRPPDAEQYSKSRAGNQEWRSDELDSLWGKGRVTFQDFSIGAAKYIGGHDGSKLTRSARHVVDEWGEVHELEPEFRSGSRRSAPGRKYVEAYGEQMLHFGNVVVAGREVAVPAYMANRAKLSFPEQYEEFAAKRKAAALEIQSRPGPSLHAIEFCAIEQIKRGSRKHGLG